ncbi:hypothetical protein PINS_up000425 [Pythium insidiosum]|nr:hypothetical protein PINS_up000425 [Pythium insidiosum]
MAEHLDAPKRNVTALATTIVAITADARLRCELVKAKCGELERVLDALSRMQTARQATRAATRRRQREELAASEQLQDSISAAIRRARRIREEMRAGGGGEPSEQEATKEEDDDDPPPRVAYKTF